MLFATAVTEPARAQNTDLSLWTATVTTAVSGGSVGWVGPGSGITQYGSVDSNSFTLDSTTYTVQGLYSTGGAGTFFFLDQELPAGTYRLTAGSWSAQFSGAGSNSFGQSRYYTLASVSSNLRTSEWAEGSSLSVSLCRGTGQCPPPTPTALGQVTGLAVTPAVNSLSLAWSAVADATGYKVQWKSPTQAFDSSREAAVTGTTHTIPSLTPGTQYTVRVAATKSGEEDGDWSGEMTGTPSAPPPTNRPPAFGADTATLAVDENTAAGTDIGAALTATDPDSDTLTYTLEGTDAASFAIDSATGQLQTKSGVTYDHEAKPSYSVTVKAADPDGASDTIAVTVNLVDLDEPPLKPAAPLFDAATSLLTWGAPDNAGREPITGYDLRQKLASAANFGSPTTDVTSPHSLALTPNTAYHFQIRAKNAEGTGPWSDSLTVQTVPPAEPGAELRRRRQHHARGGREHRAGGAHAGPRCRRPTRTSPMS